MVIKFLSFLKILGIFTKVADLLLKMSKIDRLYLISMKKFSLSIFLISFVVLAGVIGALFAVGNASKETASSNPPPSPTLEKVEIFVQESERLVVGQIKQLYLTVKPTTATITVSFDKENIVSLDSNYKILALASGKTNCTISASHKGIKESKIVEIFVFDKQVDFDCETETFFAGETLDYVLKIESNFELVLNDFEVSNNIIVKNFAPKSALNKFVYEMVFSLKESGSFSVKVEKFVFENFVFIKPSF